MTSVNLEKLRYPIGKFKKPDKINRDQINDWIMEIAKFPERLASLVQNLSPEELSFAYRPDGWIIRQVVHHCADSHMNAFIRFKLTLTEDTPTIKPYFEDRWAKLADTINTPISESLKILEGLHIRWTTLLKSLNPDDWKREFVHPEQGRRITLEENAGIYAWHCNHHLAHVKQALRYKGSF